MVISGEILFFFCMSILILVLIDARLAGQNILFPSNMAAA
jgi:hypothetical protein